MVHHLFAWKSQLPGGLRVLTNLHTWAVWVLIAGFLALGLGIGYKLLLLNQLLQHTSALCSQRGVGNQTKILG